MVLIYFKRIMDVVSTLTGLLFTVPILLSVAFIIRISMGSPVLFRQVRPAWMESLSWCTSFARCLI